MASRTIQRFLDILSEPKQPLPPIMGYERAPLVSLEQAVDPLVNEVPEVKRMVWTVKQNYETPADGLTIDESASIRLYSLEWQPKEKSFYFFLNAALRAKDRSILRSWFLYLKLCIYALSKLPSNPCTVYRGVKADLRKDYPVKATPIWWAFSSCTTMMSVLQAEEYLGKTGTRTMFQIDCHSGKDIRQHSFFESENEILLLPARQFQVMSCLNAGNSLYIIHMKEIDPEFPLLNPIEVTSIPALMSSSNLNTIKWMSSAVTVAGGYGLGSASNQLHYPYSFCLDDDHETNPTIYIADSYNHRIITSSGEVVVGRHGLGARLDQLSCPVDILLDKPNNAWIISDRGNRRVMRWSREDRTKGEILVDNIDCWGIALDKEGRLYVADTDKHDVKQFRPGSMTGIVVAGGNGKGDAANQLNSPHYIAVDQKLSIYVSDYKNNRIMKWEENGRTGRNLNERRRLSSLLTRLSGPEGIVIDAMRAVCVADSDNHRIVRWNPIEQQFNTIAGGKGSGVNENQLHYPRTVAFDRKGNLYVLDWRNHRLQCFKIEST